MARRTKLFLGAAVLLVVGVGVAVWLIWFPPWAKSLERRMVGKWRLVRAGGQAPADSWIKSQEIDLAANGTWTSKIEGDGFAAGMTAKGGGTWSVAGDVLTCTLDGPGNPKGVDTVKSQVRIESERLIVDPDHFMQVRKKGPAVVGEYER